MSRYRNHLLNLNLSLNIKNNSLIRFGCVAKSKSTNSKIFQASMKMAEKYPAVIICGPSGTGKSTILKRITQAHPNTFQFSISHTTRKPRGAEEHGKDYYFVTREEFENRIGENGFIEWAEFSGNLYGTSGMTVDDAASKDKICILDIEIEGVKQIKESGRKAKYLFLRPPSLEELEKRLRGRGTEKEDKIMSRLNQARNELIYGEQEGNFDLIVTNDDLDKAHKEVEEFMLKDL